MTRKILIAAAGAALLLTTPWAANAQSPATNSVAPAAGDVEIVQVARWRTYGRPYAYSRGYYAPYRYGYYYRAPRYYYPRNYGYYPRYYGYYPRYYGYYPRYYGYYPRYYGYYY